MHLRTNRGHAFIAYQHHIGPVDSGFTLHDPSLFVLVARPGMPLDGIDIFNQDAVLIWIDIDDLTDFSLILAGDHLDLIVFFDLYLALTLIHIWPLQTLKHLGCQRYNFHKPVCTEFSRHRPKNSGTDGLPLSIYQNRRVLIKPNERAVRTANLLFGPHHDRFEDVAFPDFRIRHCLLDRDHDDIPDAGIAPPGAPQHFYAGDHFCPRSEEHT